MPSRLSSQSGLLLISLSCGGLTIRNGQLVSPGLLQEIVSLTFVSAKHKSSTTSIASPISSNVSTSQYRKWYDLFASTDAISSSFSKRKWKLPLPRSYPLTRPRKWKLPHPRKWKLPLPYCWHEANEFFHLFLLKLNIQTLVPPSSSDKNESMNEAKFYPKLEKRSLDLRSYLNQRMSMKMQQGAAERLEADATSGG
ncbi:unnamed protein product [Cochlearia groenlandica]